MRRREFLFGVALVVHTSHAMAEQRATLKRIAMAHPVTKPGDMTIGGDPNFAIFFEEMQRLGYVEGVNMIVDRYSAEGHFDRYGELARKIVATRPDVIFPMTTRLLSRFYLKHAQFQSSPGHLIQSPLGSCQIWQDLAATSLG